MKRSITLGAMLVFFVTLILTSTAFADQEWIRDILERKDRYVNIEVTVVGQVLAVQANPAGTTRGTFQIQDESTKDTLTVESKELPLVGKSYSVTGMILIDPNTSNPYLKETGRTSAGFPPTMKILLYGGGALFVILLIVFITLLVKPKSKAPAQATVRPMPRPEAAEPALDKTVKMPTSPAAPPVPEVDKTQVFVNLGANIIIDKGPNEGKEFTLHKQVMTIGRPGARKNDIELDDNTVSKEQASIFYDNTTRGFTIKNESTTNPTMMNKNVITSTSELNDGDVIEMGKTILRFKKE